MHTARVLCVSWAHASISWRQVLFWCVWYGLRSSRSESEQWVWCVNIETGSSSTRTQTIPDASEKDLTSRNRRMSCAYSLKVVSAQKCSFVRCFRRYQTEKFYAVTAVKLLYFRTGTETNILRKELRLVLSYSDSSNVQQRAKPRKTLKLNRKQKQSWISKLTLK